jgi:DNA-binding CsgD family transcriptional regulator
VSQETYLKRTSEQLDVLTRLLGVALGQGKTLREQIEALSRAGLEPKEIADIVGTNPNAVSVALYQLKKAGKRRTK